MTQGLITRQYQSGKALCMCGCGSAVGMARENRPSRGWVKGRPLLYLIGHQRRLSAVDYRVNEETGCWEWQLGLKGRGGYGTKWTPSGPQSAHRWMYETKVGPIPGGMQLDHLCRNRACVNPEHLEPVTPAENIRRGAGTKLTAAQVREIRGAEGRTRDIADRYGITEAYCSRLRYGHRWPSVKDDIRWEDA